MIPLVGSVLAASLLGSPHCAGMCGGFVCFYAGQANGSSRALAHAAYNGGRLMSYVLLGGIAGALGAGIDAIGSTAGLQRGAAVLAGAALIVWGALSFLKASGIRVPATTVPPALGRGLAAGIRAVSAQPPAVRALVVGLLTTLLPCGFLYAFVAIAAGTGSPLSGSVVMAVFWAGTVPVMAGLGFVAQRALGPLRRRVPALTAAVLVALGLLTMAGKFLPGQTHHHAPAALHGHH